MIKIRQNMLNFIIKNNILNINKLYDINIDEKVYCLKEINLHLIDPYANALNLMKKYYLIIKQTLKLIVILNIKNLLLIQTQIYI